MIPHRDALLLSLLSAMVALVGAAAVLLLREAAARDLRIRVRDALAGEGSYQLRDQAGLGRRFLDTLRSFGEKLRNSRRLYSAQDIEALEGIIAATGFRPKKLLPIVLAAKMLFTVLVVVAAVLVGIVARLPTTQFALVLAVAMPIGLMAPEMVLRMLRRRYVSAVRRGVADALDLLVVCTEAGMGLESALEQVAREMQHSNSAIAVSLTVLLDELKILPDRREAFNNFGRRTGVDGIRRMATVLGQTLQYGTPLGQALRAMATELRRERMIQLEAKAVRLPALLVFPLVMFILPSLFIALMGPTMLRLLDTLHSAAIK